MYTTNEAFEELAAGIRSDVRLYWDAHELPMPQRYLQNRYAPLAARLGLGWVECRRMLQQRRWIEPYMSLRGTVYLIPADVWDAKGQAEQALFRIELEAYAEHRYTKLKGTRRSSPRGGGALRRRVEVSEPERTGPLQYFAGAPMRAFVDKSKRDAD